MWRPARANADLRVILRRVGRSGDLASKIRDSLLGIARIVPYVETNGAAWLSAETRPRFRTLRQDIYSLSQYDEHLNVSLDYNKVIKRGYWIALCRRYML